MTRVKYGLLSLAFLVTSTVGVQACAQEVAKANKHYEKLKVLEPLIGTFQVRGRLEADYTFSWHDNKRMIIGTTKVKRGDKWKEISQRRYYLWNDAHQRIERLFVIPETGTVTVDIVKPEASGVFSLTQADSTAGKSAKAQTRITVTAESLTHKVTNRVNAAGKSQGDFQFTMRRATKGESK